MTKIYGHAAHGRDYLLQRDDAGEFVHRPLRHGTLTGHVLDDGSMYFVFVPNLPTSRDDLAQIPGVTVFDSHHSPHAIKPEHHAILRRHGVEPHHTTWEAIEHMIGDVAPFRLGGHWDPNT